MTLKNRVAKLEDMLLPPKPCAEWVRIVLKGISQEAGIQQWMNENNTDIPPDNIIFRIIVHP
jgi:hypothetical protein